MYKISLTAITILLTINYIQCAPSQESWWKSFVNKTNTASVRSNPLENKFIPDKPMNNYNSQPRPVAQPHPVQLGNQRPQPIPQLDFHPIPAVHQVQNIHPVPVDRPVPQPDFHPIPAVHQVQNIHPVPVVNQVSAVYQVPDVHPVPVVRPVPSVHQVPAVYQVPDVHQVPAVYQVPDVHQVPAVYQVPDVHQVPAVYQVPDVHQVPAVHPVPVIQNVAPFQIQQPVVAATGELIIENTLGGVDFDCRFLPSGHFRDGNFCDVYHACVHGYHRKTYTCPIVGERTYFDEFTQRCEFVHLNPAGCSMERFVR